jgi:RNA polymerase sigma-70 factor (ECF subfamily)
MCATRTSTELLRGLRDRLDAAAWGLFNERYRPIVVNYARRCGLQPADAEDIAQESLTEFLRAYRAGRYDRARGTRLRDWLKGIAANRVKDFLRRQARGQERQVASTDSQTDFMLQVPAGEEEDPWEHEWRAAVLKMCIDAVRTEFDTGTLHAFEEYAVRQRPVGDVAQELGMTPNAIYIAKSRVIERMRVLVEDFDLAAGALT